MADGNAEVAMPPITNTPIDAAFRDTVIMFLRETRESVENARCVTSVSMGALRNVNLAEAEDVADILREHVENDLCQQVDRLDAMIASVEAQEVYRV